MRHLESFSRYAWGRLDSNKLTITAVHVLNNDVLPLFESYNARISTVLNANGCEFCDRKNHHSFDLFFQLEEVEH